MKNVRIKSVNRNHLFDRENVAEMMDAFYPSFQGYPWDMMNDDEEKERKKEKEFTNRSQNIYIFPLNIEILRAFLELFDAGSANPVNFTAQVSMIAESTVYPFFSVPLGKRKFPGRGRESWFRLEGERNFRGRVSSTRLIRIVEAGGARLSRVEPMKITAKRKVERSFPIMEPGIAEPGRVATCWPQLHWKLIST